VSIFCKFLFNVIDPIGQCIVAFTLPIGKKKMAGIGADNIDKFGYGKFKK
jgi:hypothetical protein